MSENDNEINCDQCGSLCKLDDTYLETNSGERICEMCYQILN